MTRGATPANHPDRTGLSTPCLTEEKCKGRRQRRGDRGSQMATRETQDNRTLKGPSNTGGCKRPEAKGEEHGGGLKSVFLRPVHKPRKLNATYHKGRGTRGGWKSVFHRPVYQCQTKLLTTKRGEEHGGDGKVHSVDRSIKPKPNCCHTKGRGTRWGWKRVFHRPVHQTQIALKSTPRGEEHGGVGKVYSFDRSIKPNLLNETASS